ncbi:hypothetical protein LCGC14_2187880 [marine sediment metagenome]|uniref:Thiamine pyrophosphate enzyme N-terminal TPP-binding domain-containing protein n=1 Tax=marine sediment metagenome TaxID=412755 RepID=A0A0F9DKK8_9ZZZZ
MPDHKQVMTAAKFMNQLQDSCDWYTGVPSGRLKAIYRAIPEDKYYFAPREDHAMAMAFGARLMGKKPVVFMQNSGVGYIGDVVCGLYNIYKTGVIMVVDCIGESPERPPQHVEWGYNRTVDVLVALGIWVRDLLHTENTVALVSNEAWRLNRPVAILIREGVINAN